MLLMGVVVRAAVLGFQEIHEKCIDLLKGNDDLGFTGEVRSLSLLLSSQEDSGLSD